MNIEYYRKQLRYDPTTGHLWWVSRRRGRRTDRPAGALDKLHGYIRIQIDGESWLAHRLAWALHYNGQPPKEIDHKNRIRSDNRIDNLRAVTHSENMHNLGGQRGVSFCNTRKRWTAYYGKRFLGRFDTYEEALNVRRREESSLLD